MIIFSSNPVWASVGAILFFKEKLSAKLVICYILCLLSIYLLVYQDLKISGVSSYGDLSAMVSALFYACYMLTGKKARHHFENSFYAFMQYLVCALCFGLCIIWQGSEMGGYDDISWICVAGLILFPTFLGHFTLTYLLNHMNITLMTCGKVIEPILASLMAHYIFHEQLAPLAWISFLLTACAILILFGSGVSNYIKARILNRP